MHPIADVLDGGVGGGGGAGQAPSLDDGGASLLHGGDEVVLHPFHIHQFGGGLAGDGAMVDVGVLGGGVVAPDNHARHIAAVAAGFGRQLRDGAVVVKAGHCGELGGGQVRGVAAGDEGVSVGGVAHHQHLHLTGGMGVDGRPLRREYLGVGLKQVFALHPRPSRAGAHQQTEIRVLEGHSRVIGGDDAFYQWKGAVLNLHHRAFQRIKGRRNLQQLQNHRLLPPQHPAGGDAEQQRVSNLPGSTGNGHPHGLFLSHLYSLSVVGDAGSVTDFGRRRHISGTGAWRRRN